MNLVIVESPTKAKTISRFLGKDFEIRASMGHVMDLPKSKLGVDVENSFAPAYEINVDKKAIIAELKKLSKTATKIILATDPDREGEAISFHIQEVLVDKYPSNAQKISRIVFHEITKEAIDIALSHPGVVDMNLVNSQTARRVLDRLVGYKLSPLLWQKVRRGLSAGRVQSVALRFIVEREREIEKFQKEAYWTITVVLFKDKHQEVSCELIEIDGKKIEKQQEFSLYDGKYTVTTTDINTNEAAEKILHELNAKEFIVQQVSTRETKRTPQPPFTTSTLQQQASQRFGFSGKRTMSLAQKLYEEGFITYHRTDSVNLASSAIDQMRTYIENKHGKTYIPKEIRSYIVKQKLAQEAHEAIRPTKIITTEETIQATLGRDYARLYDLIWRRALASQMSDALIESTTIYVEAKNGATPTIYRFKTTGSVLLFDGFLKINPFGNQDKILPKLNALDRLNLLNVLTEKHESTPPPRYNDASLIGSLEDGGIGRPSTYASIIGTIEARLYIERDQKKFMPTPIGLAVNDFLVANFSDIDDIPFTARMEDELDSVANGQKEWVPVLREFYAPFEKHLKEVATVARVAISTEETGKLCPKDAAPLVIRVGKFGKFISCKNFPTCDFKAAYVEETDQICPKDSGKIIVKKTKKGKPFYGCANYPTCDFAIWKLQDLNK